MPNKHNAGKRHHIPKAKYTISNWPQYEAGLKQRGSLTLWLTPEAIEQWKAAARTTPGGQARYSDMAIQTCLMLRAAFRIPLRQAEGLMASVVSLMNLALTVPGVIVKSGVWPYQATLRSDISFSACSPSTNGTKQPGGCKSMCGRIALF